MYVPNEIKDNTLFTLLANMEPYKNILASYKIKHLRNFVMTFSNKINYNSSKNILSL